MKDFVLDGRVTFIDNNNGLKVCGASTINDDEIGPSYNSFSYSDNVVSNKLNSMFGSPYKIEISGTKKDDFNEYMLVKIDALNTGDNSIAYVFKGTFSTNVTSTENTVLKIILRPENDLIKSLKYGNKYYFKLSISDREDADF